MTKRDLKVLRAELRAARAAVRDSRREYERLRAAGLVVGLHPDGSPHWTWQLTDDGAAALAQWEADNAT